MPGISVTLSMCDYDRTRPLVDGRVSPQGVELNVLLNPIEASVTRMLRFLEFDAAEMSLSAAMIATERGVPDLVSIPIFPSKYFRHSAIFVRDPSPLEDPAELRGLRVAAPTYARLTAGVWLRGILEDDYGVALEEIDWVVAEPLPVGSQDRIPVELPDGLSVNSAPPGTSLEAMLRAGEVDALISARLTRPPALQRGLRRLVRNAGAVERDYFRRTGIFPMMHVIVIRRDLYERHPWIGPSLFTAFTEAGRLALSDLHEIDVSRYSLAWSVDYAAEERILLGDDAWAHGLAANRQALETFARYCRRQGLTRSAVDADAMFPENTRPLRDAVAPNTLS
jgi:4,5-dihydroxyphthalate decarboxylase